MTKYLLLLSFALCSCTASVYVPSAKTGSADEPLPEYVCERTPIAPKIDGVLDDPCWQKARYSAPFCNILGVQAPPLTPHETRVQMVWDDECLYVGARLKTPHLWATRTVRDTVIYQDDDFEVFIDPDGDERNYIELEINALNTVWDLFLTAPYSEPGQIALHDWDIKQLRHAVSCEGTLNLNTDTDSAWCVELAIPWASVTGHHHLPRRGDPPKNGQCMKMNFSRVSWEVSPDSVHVDRYCKRTGADHAPLPEKNEVWAPTGEINIHKPARWGNVYFSEKEVGSKESPLRFHQTPFTLFLWVHGGNAAAEPDLWNTRIAEYARAGIDTLIADGSPADVACIAERAVAHNMHCIGWVWTLNQCADSQLPNTHPAYFAVNAEGKSCAVPADRPYVPYYAFLCPNHPEVRTLLAERAVRYAQVPFVSAIQLDYIRMVDVILPRGLWEKYNLVQDHEMPAYDFCYCARCLEKFRQKTGRLPNRNDPEHDEKWRAFRLQSVAECADFIAEAVRDRTRKPCGGAVFPTPDIAAQLVRQDYRQFAFDFALPMTYYAFYNATPAWCAEKTREAREQIQDRFPLYPGLHLPDHSPETLGADLDALRASGARGAALFSSEMFSEAFQDALRTWKAAQLSTHP